MPFPTKEREQHEREEIASCGRAEYDRRHALRVKRMLEHCDAEAMRRAHERKTAISQTKLLDLLGYLDVGGPSDFSAGVSHACAVIRGAIEHDKLKNEYVTP